VAVFVKLAALTPEEKGRHHHTAAALSYVTLTPEYWLVIELTVPVTVPPVKVTVPVFTLNTLRRIPLTRLLEGSVITVAEAEFMQIVVPARMSPTVTVYDAVFFDIEPEATTSTRFANARDAVG
jgi:hypothetical protein